MSDNKEQKFYKALQDVFIGAKIEGQGGFVNLMKIKSNYYSKIETLLKKDIEDALKQYPDFRNELFDKLYSFFSRYFSESGSIYFNSTPFHNNVYEKVYSDEKDVILFWKTRMLYYVKTDRIFRSLEIESDGFKFFFDVSNLENKKANEKRSLVFEYDKVENNTIIFNVYYSEKGKTTKIDEITKALKKNKLNISEEQLEHAFRIFEKQSEVDFFINKNAKAFLQEQFNLWSFQYFWDGASQWTADRVNQLQILKDIAYKIIDFISQFEDELVKIWNKPKFVRNSNYVITLDRIWEANKTKLENERSEFPSDRVVSRSDGVLTNAPETKSTKWYELPYNPDLKERARELRKAGNLPEVIFWQQVKGKQFLGLDFDRQKIIGNYIADFFIKDIGVIVEIDGDSHNNKKEYDKQRDEYFESLGLRVIHVRAEDVKNDVNGVMRYIKECIERTPLTPLQEGDVTPLTPLKEGNLTPGQVSPDNPLQEGNLVKKILKHPGIDQQINEWRELGMVDDSFNIDEIIENDLLDEHLNKKYEHLPIDTKYFKDIELEILSQFDDLDKSLDGWLIKSENYQALNTILPKFKEKVQTIYIDPPFNTGSDFDYVDRFQDSSWLSLMHNRIALSKNSIRKDGSIFLHLDRNADYFGRFLLQSEFGSDCYKNDIIWKYFVSGKYPNEFAKDHDRIIFYGISSESMFNYEKEFDIELYNEKKAYSQIVVKNNVEYYLYNGELRTFEKQVGETWRINKIKRDGKETFGFKTQKPEELVKRIIRCSTIEKSIILDFFLGSGTTTAVAHKLGRKWLGIEMGEYFNTFYFDNSEKKTGIVGRMKEVLSGYGNHEPCGITKDVNWQGGGFFKYYELEQYEETLANCKYEDGDLFQVPGRSPYEEYVFLKDEKLLKAMEIDYEKEKINIDLSKLYPNIDIAETLSNLTGKWIKKIIPCQTKSNTTLQEDDVTPLAPLHEGDVTPLTPLQEGNYRVEFDDETIIDTTNLDYKLIKPLIWWE